MSFFEPSVMGGGGGVWESDSLTLRNQNVWCFVYIYMYGVLSKTVYDPTTQQVLVARGSGFNALEQILSITTVPVEPPPKIQEYMHQRVLAFVYMSVLKPIYMIK